MEKDRILIKKVLRGNLKSFQELIKSHQRLVAHVVFRMVSNREDQEEICQEVFIKVYQNLSQFKFESKLSTWIGRIAYNTALNYMRKEKVTLMDDLRSETDHGTDHANTLALLESDTPTPDQLTESHDRFSIIHKQMKKLPAIQRTILTLFHLEQMSYQEIGEIMHLPEGTIKSYLFRGRKKLKDVLVQELEGEVL